MVAPRARSVAASTNSALPERPAVSVGWPSQRVVEAPAMVVQIWWEAACSS
jgi:hypothetical protein